MPYNYGNYYGNNNGYQMNNAQYGYQNQMQQPQMSYQQPQQMNYQQQAYQMAPQGNQSIIWVQGEAGAKAYPVAAGQSVLLMDSEDAVLYVKSTDVTGRPLPMESYDLVKRDSVVNVPQISQRASSQGQTNQAMNTNEFVKMSDLETKVSEMVSKAVDKAVNKALNE